MIFNKNLKKSRGQIALAVLLVSALMLTVGLSLSRRTTSETSVNTAQEESKKAFNAAESGVDYYLATATPVYSAPSGDKSAKVSVSFYNNVNNSVFLPYAVTPSSPGFFWLVGHGTDDSIDTTTFYGANDLKLCVDVGSQAATAVQVDYFFNSNNQTYVSRRGFDISRGGTTNLVNNYQVMTAQSGSCTSGWQVDLTPLVHDLGVGKTIPYLLAVRPYGGTARMGIMGTALMPQGWQIDSTGYSGEVKRKVTAWRGYSVPSFMLDPLVAGGSVLNQ